MTPDPKDASVLATQNELAAVQMYDIAVASMLLNGLDPNYKVTLIFEHAKFGGTAVVGRIGYERSKEILQKYIDKNAEADQATADAMKKMRGNQHG